MNLNKKGVQTHIVILLITSLIVTVLLLSIFGIFIKQDNENCQYVNFEITSSHVKNENSVDLQIKNTGGTRLYMKSIGDGVENRQGLFELGPEESGNLNIPAKSEIELIPIYTAPISKESFLCNRKSKEINVNTIMN